MSQRSALVLGTIVVVGMIIALFSLPARSQQLQLASGMACDTQAQLAEFIAAENKPDALKLINERDGDHSCAAGVWHLIKGEKVSTVMMDGKVWDITRVMVVATLLQRVGPHQYISIPFPEAKIWFVAFPSTAQPS